MKKWKQISEVLSQFMTKLIFGLVYLIIFPFFFILLIRPKVTGSFWIPRNPKKTNLQSMG